MKSGWWISSLRGFLSRAGAEQGSPLSKLAILTKAVATMRRAQGAVCLVRVFRVVRGEHIRLANRPARCAPAGRRQNGEKTREWRSRTTPNTRKGGIDFSSRSRNSPKILLLPHTGPAASAATVFPAPHDPLPRPAVKNLTTPCRAKSYRLFPSKLMAF